MAVNSNRKSKRKHWVDAQSGGSLKRRWKNSSGRELLRRRRQQLAVHVSQRLQSTSSVESAMPRIEPLPIDPRDVENLKLSGVDIATALRNHLRTQNEALEIVYRDLFGAENCFRRRRLHKPKIDSDGHSRRYEQPPNSGCRAYFPANSVDALRDGDSPIHIVEGEKKSLCLEQRGLTTVGLGGVWNFTVKGLRELIADLLDVKWKARDVFITFDWDEKPETRQTTDKARRRLAGLIRREGAKEVYAVELPPGTSGEKQGVDDFIVANGLDAYLELVASAKPVPTDDLPSLKSPAGRTDKANAARLMSRFRNEHRWVPPWDKWLAWDGRRWCLDAELRIRGCTSDAVKAKERRDAAVRALNLDAKPEPKSLAAYIIEASQDAESEGDDEHS